MKWLPWGLGKIQTFPYPWLPSRLCCSLSKNFASKQVWEKSEKPRRCLNVLQCSEKEGDKTHFLTASNLGHITGVEKVAWTFL